MHKRVSRRTFTKLGAAAVLGMPVVRAGRAVAAPVASEPARWTPVEPPNRPIGQAKGIFPGRVAWLHEPEVAKWDGDVTAGNWFDDKSTDAELADQMFRKSLRLVSGTETDSEAWAALFKHYNRTHGRGDAGYRPGEKVAVKLNLNCCTPKPDRPPGFYNTPQVTMALLRQLVEQAGVRVEDLVICDASRWVSDSIFVPARAAFPGLRFECCYGVEGRFKVQPDMDAPLHFGDPDTPDTGKTYLPACLTGATYLINGAVMKGHSLAGITLCAKNHFGSVYRENTGPADRHQGWNPSNLHSTILTPTRPMGTYNAMVDLMVHKDLGGKTILYLIDALYAAPHQSTGPEKWQSPPFDGHWTASLFASQDPVAIESVAVDLFGAEPSATRMVGAIDNYLHEAALAHRPPSGTRYDPAGNGTTPASLGVHEHWNGPEKKQYSRNLGTGKGIELLRQG